MNKMNPKKTDQQQLGLPRLLFLVIYQEHYRNEGIEPLGGTYLRPG